MNRHRGVFRAVTVRWIIALLLLSFLTTAANAADAPANLTRSARSGLWSAPATWENGQVPADNSQVQIRAGDRVVYDLPDSPVFRVVHVAGTLSFDPTRDTRLNVGLLLIRPGENPADDGLLHAAHVHNMADMNAGPVNGPIKAGPAALLEVGTLEQPVAADHHAVIRLTPIDGMDPNAYPALVNYGGRVEIHGATLDHPWTRLRATAAAGSSSVTLTTTVPGWRVGDRVIVVTTADVKMFTADGQVKPSVKVGSQTEERFIQSVDGQVVSFDKPLGFDHAVDGDFRGEVGNLSRNVVIESADMAVRGHTMFHRDSPTVLQYAEFRHLGKEGQLGRYAIHFHQAGDTIRGSSVVGCSIWDSANRWITLHGTNYMVVRDCVAYQSIGHGFYLEDGTEEYNVFDRNLAVQAMKGATLPGQLLPYDKNDGAAFWWANSLNTFRYNIAAECDQYGYRFEAGKPEQTSPFEKVRQDDGSYSQVDIRTQPFVRFIGNEAQSMRRYAFNLGGFRLVAGEDGYVVDKDGKRTLNPDTVTIGDVGGVGPDVHHPFVIQNYRAWHCFWVFHSASPSVFIDGLTARDCDYGIWRTRIDHHQYKNMSMSNIRTADIYNPWGGPPDFAGDYQKSIKRTYDLPPATVITAVVRNRFGGYRVYGTTSSNTDVAKVLVNGHPATATQDNFAEWSAEISESEASASIVTAVATDTKENVEITPPTVRVPGTPVVSASAAR